jgi:hypothetical protein
MQEEVKEIRSPYLDISPEELNGRIHVFTGELKIINDAIIRALTFDDLPKKYNRTEFEEYLQPKKQTFESASSLFDKVKQQKKWGKLFTTAMRDYNENYSKITGHEYTTKVTQNHDVASEMANLIDVLRDEIANAKDFFNSAEENPLVAFASLKKANKSKAHNIVKRILSVAQAWVFLFSMTAPYMQPVEMTDDNNKSPTKIVGEQIPNITDSHDVAVLGDALIPEPIRFGKPPSPPKGRKRQDDEIIL